MAKLTVVQTVAQKAVRLVVPMVFQEVGRSVVYWVDPRAHLMVVPSADQWAVKWAGQRAILLAERLAVESVDLTVAPMDSN